jgi:DNA-binding transcriptional regulator PaaX
MAKKASPKRPQKGFGQSSRSTTAPPSAESSSLNRNLHAAKTAKQDEFYTQYADIQKEVESSWNVRWTG